MGNYIITRHCGAIEWFRRHLAASTGPIQVLAHLDNVPFGPGDRVYGVLPLGLAADVCASGAELHVLTCDTPAHLRGRELTADELEQLGARLVRYEVREIRNAECRSIGSGCRG